jgi:hypothetical protein
MAAMHMLNVQGRLLQSKQHRNTQHRIGTFYQILATLCMHIVHLHIRNSWEGYPSPKRLTIHRRQSKSTIEYCHLNLFHSYSTRAVACVTGHNEMKLFFLINTLVITFNCLNCVGSCSSQLNGNTLSLHLNFSFSGALLISDLWMISEDD